MRTISHTITDALGLHARPAGQVVKIAKEFKGKVEIGTEKKMVDCKRIMGVMSLSLKKGDTIKIVFDGDGEEAVIEKMSTYLSAEL